MSIISVNNVSKKFKIRLIKNHSILATIYQSISGKEQTQDLWALNNVSFSVQRGEIIGIIGENGAGKSTLLSIIAGIYRPNGGNLKVNGKVISVLGLESGLLERLTMRDNIYLCCAFYGLTRKMVHGKIKSIVHTSELEKFIDAKIYQFSSGMKARLIFSISIHCNPNILLLDEVTSNIDKHYSKVIEKTIKNLSNSGITFLVVSHRLNIIEQCDKTIYLSKGRVVMKGNTQEVIKKYWKS